MQDNFQSKQCIGNYAIEDLIGEGSYAKIFKARDLTLQCNVALKVFSKNSPNKDEILHHFDTEVAILSKLKHPFIIELFEVIENENCKVMVLEYIEKGTLLSHINKVHKLKEETSKRIFSQLISVFTYLHEEMKIVHCDIKLENILIDRHNNIRLIDFGFASEVINTSPQLTQTNGSPSYVAPEIIKGYKYNSAVDIWSSGIILYILLIGKLPFFGDSISSQLNNILNLNPDIPSDITSLAQDLILRLLNKDPFERIILSDIRKHKWIAKEYDELQKTITSCNKIYQKPDKEVFSIMQECGLSTTGLMSKILGNSSICKVEQAYYVLRRAKISDFFGGKKYIISKKSENIVLKSPTRSDDLRSHMMRSRARTCKENQHILINQFNQKKKLNLRNEFTPQSSKQAARRFTAYSNYIHRTFEDV